jgi:hypothetical protein
LRSLSLQPGHLRSALSGYIVESLSKEPFPVLYRLLATWLESFTMLETWLYFSPHSSRYGAAFLGTHLISIIFLISTKSPACSLYRYTPLAIPAGRDHSYEYEPADNLSKTSVATSSPRTCITGLEVERYCFRTHISSDLYFMNVALNCRSSVEVSPVLTCSTSTPVITIASAPFILASSINFS